MNKVCPAEGCARKYNPNVPGGYCGRHSLVYRVYGDYNFTTKETDRQLASKSPNRTKLTEEQQAVNRQKYLHSLEEIEAETTPTDKLYTGGKRTKPSAKIQDKLLDIYGNRCVYCGLLFGSIVHRHGKMYIQGITWDHFVPYSLVNIDDESNWFPVCQICNGIKSSNIFGTVGAAREYIVSAREQKGYTS